MAMVPAVVSACSVRAGYRVPTTLDLVREADVITVARVASQVDAPAWEGRKVRFVGGIFLKDRRGLPEGSRIEVVMPGVIAAPDMPATPSDPAELHRANPEAYEGGCTRQIFAEDVPVLLFLKRDGISYRALSYPFARTAEDAPDLMSRWVKAVREYGAIGALPVAAQRARLAVRRDLLRERGDADSLAIAEDMDRELRRPRTVLGKPLSDDPDAPRR